MRLSRFAQHIRSFIRQRVDEASLDLETPQKRTTAPLASNKRRIVRAMVSF